MADYFANGSQVGEPDGSPEEVDDTEAPTAHVLLDQDRHRIQ
jgi:hypothetical protein